MKVILTRDIAKLGKKNDVIEVSNSYASNVLIPKGDVRIATAQVIKEIEQKKKAKVHKSELQKSLFLQTVAKIKEVPIIISGKKHSKGSLFAHITEEDVIESIYKAIGASFNTKQIDIPKNIKHFGVYQVTLKEGDKREVIDVEVRE